MHIPIILGVRMRKGLARRGAVGVVYEHTRVQFSLVTIHSKLYKPSYSHLSLGVSCARFTAVYSLSLSNLLDLLSSDSLFLEAFTLLRSLDKRSLLSVSVSACIAERVLVLSYSLSKLLLLSSSLCLRFLSVAKRLDLSVGHCFPWAVLKTFGSSIQYSVKHE